MKDVIKNMSAERVPLGQLWNHNSNQAWAQRGGQCSSQRVEE